MRHFCDARLILASDDGREIFAFTIAPFLPCIVNDPVCGKPAVESHEGNGGPVHLCAKHWDEYMAFREEQKRG